MAEEENATTSSTDDKPFFAIDAQDVAEAAAENSTTPPASSTMPQPPQPMMLGTLSAPTPSVAASADNDGSNADPEVKANPWGASVPQLTGDINAMGGQGMFTLPAPVEKEGFRWGQYAIGFVTPIVVLFMFGMVGEFLSGSDNYEDPWRGEEIRMQSEDGQTFEIQFVMDQDEVMEGFYSYFETERGYEISISYWYDRYESNSVSVYQYNQSSGSETEIGTYYETNSTAFFQLSDTSADELWLSVNYYNPELDDYGAVDTFETLFCFLPFIYLAGVIAAFVRGNKALAYGLLTPLMLWFALMGAIILMLIAFW